MTNKKTRVKKSPRKTQMTVTSPTPMEVTDSVTPPIETVVRITELKPSTESARIGITLTELERRLQEQPPNYLVDGLLPTDDVHVMIGDSGLGKTPLAYQLGLCVAAGKPFLGHEVRPSRALYYDVENGASDIVQVSRALCGYLGIEAFPKDFLVVPNDGNLPDVEHAVADRKPGLVIIDTLRALHPEVEMDNPRMARFLNECKRIARESHCAILLIHHTRKPGEMGSASLEHTPIIEWLNEASGARALINQTTARIGLERSRSTSRENVALVMKSHVKVKGENGPIYLERVLDPDGEPIGYRRITGVGLLGNSAQEAAFEKLPEKFRFSEAKRIYEKTDNPTREWLKKCLGLSLIRQTGRGMYERV